MIHPTAEVSEISEGVTSIQPAIEVIQEISEISSEPNVEVLQTREKVFRAQLSELLDDLGNLKGRISYQGTSDDLYLVLEFVTLSQVNNDLEAYTKQGLKYLVVSATILNGQNQEVPHKVKTNVTIDWSSEHQVIGVFYVPNDGASLQPISFEQYDTGLTFIAPTFLILLLFLLVWRNQK